MTNIDIDGLEGVPFNAPWLIMKWVEFKARTKEWGGAASKLLTGQSGSIPSNVNVSEETRQTDKFLGTVNDASIVTQGIRNVGEGAINVISSIPGIETVGDVAGAFYYGAQGDFENASISAVAIFLPAISGSEIRVLGKFASESNLLTHFEKHADEFGGVFKNAADYEKGAQSFFKNITDDVVQFIRKNGDVVQYNAKTNEFGVVNAKGNIRTYFKPEKGQDYFIDQIKKELE